MNARAMRAGAILMAAALLTGCGKSLPSANPAAPAVGPAVASVAGATLGKLVVTPAKLSFTTAAILIVTISQKNFTGAFKIVSAKPRIAKPLAASGKGPGPVKIKVEAHAAGTTVLTIRGSSGQVKKIPIVVTTGVVVIH